jgi:neutral ceramidase
VLSVLAALGLGVPALLIGTVDVDITPPELLPLGGYTERHGRIMDPGGDPLHARVLVLQQATFRVAVVSVETLTIPESLLREVKARIPSDIHLLLCATHTHSAPDSQMLNDRMTLALPGVATYKRRWLAWYSDRIAGAVTAALAAKLRTVNALEAERWTSDVNRGRRKGANPDKTATLVESGREPLFFEYAAHGTFYDADQNQTRGDWPGRVVPMAPMVLIGPIGDVSPKAPGLDHAPAGIKIDAFWSHIRDDRSRSVTRVVWKPGNRVAWVNQPIPLAPPRPHPSFEPHALGQLAVTRFAPPSASISVLRLGSLAIVGVPGEPTSILGRRIAKAGRALGFSNVLVLSHCNGWMGYILDPHDYDAGGYEATLSFYGREEGDRVVHAAALALRRAALVRHSAIRRAL